VTCLNTPWLIDAGYRGEIQVLLVNHDQEEEYTVRKGDRIAQLVLVRVEEAAFALVAADGLGEAARGAGGFGHTGT
jgi:dUTP pyrophosphatase